LGRLVDNGETERPMDIEPVEIRDFLAVHRPFDLLPRDELDRLVHEVRSFFVRKGDLIFDHGDRCEFLYIVWSGGVETLSPEGQILARLREGEIFGVRAYLNNRMAKNKTEATEDALLLTLPVSEAERLLKAYPQFSYFIAPEGAAGLRGARPLARDDSDEQINLMSTRVADLLGKAPVVAAPHETIRSAAEKMRGQGVSSILVTEGGKLAGIVTDKDLRNRVIVAGVDTTNPVSSVMTPDPFALDVDNTALDALLAMTREKIRHLPILSGSRVAGVVTNTDLLHRQTTSAVYLVRQIYNGSTSRELAECVANIPEMLLNLIDAGATADNVGRIVTSISDAATARLLQLGEEKLGPPPVPYLWMAAGSQARREQTGVSDQDNCAIIDNAYDEAGHGAYFRALAKFVNDGLNQCGYVYCPGEMMAITDRWRQPLSAWKKYFSNWIDEPDPKALMLSCTFFDLRPIRGEISLFEELQSMILEKARVNKIFQAHMTGNALAHAPPLGFFGNFAPIRGGEHDRCLDLKHNGVVPIVDIARIYALKGGIGAVNTRERLRAVLEKKAMSESGARDLLDAYEFIAITRLRHQAERIRRGDGPDNFMAPENLSHFERSHLKDAFSVVKTIQSVMNSGYGVGR